MLVGGIKVRKFARFAKFAGNLPKIAVKRGTFTLKKWHP